MSKHCFRERLAGFPVSIKFLNRGMLSDLNGFPLPEAWLLSKAETVMNWGVQLVSRARKTCS